MSRGKNYAIIDGKKVVEPKMDKPKPLPNAGSSFKSVIEYPVRYYIHEKDGEPTKGISLNKITQRLIFGDDYFGQPERPNQDTFPGVSAAFNGKWIDGALIELENGWLERSGKMWKQSNNPHHKMLLEEYQNPGTYTTYCGEAIDSCLYYFPEKYDCITRPILIELLYYCYNQKFGVEQNMDEQHIGSYKEIKFRTRRKKE